MNSSEVTASIRELIVQLTRGNAAQAEAIVSDLSGFLQTSLKSRNPEAPMKREQQTMYALDEVQTTLAQRDYRGAVAAARDASQEWNSPEAVPGGGRV